MVCLSVLLAGGRAGGGGAPGSAAGRLPFSQPCVDMWAARWPVVRNQRPHTSHSYGRASVCSREWTRSPHLVPNVALQTRHWKSRWPEWTRRWPRRVDLTVNLTWGRRDHCEDGQVVVSASTGL